MISLPRDKVAIIPIRDPDKTGAEHAYREGQEVRFADGSVMKAGAAVQLVIPDVAKERTDQGIVKYIGKDCKYVQIGMYVTFSGYSGTVLGMTDPETGKREELIIVSEDFVYAEIDDAYQLEIPGLYFRAGDLGYMQATYEQALELLAWAVRDHRKRFPLNIKTFRPQLEDYNKMRGG